MATTRVERSAQPTTSDYFKLLAARAVFAADQGNYAISAALVIRDIGTEAVFEGWNTLFAERQPSGHAEMNAIRLAHAVAGLPDGVSSAIVERARAADAIHATRTDSQAREQVLYTTLEPCPMCTVCLINAGVDHVIIAAPDAPSGTLEPSRLRQLPSVWPRLAEAGGLRVTFCQSHDPSDAISYLPQRLHDELLNRFENSRTGLDQQLGDHGVLDFRAASTHVWQLVDGG
jgi:tRNA(Arg) A34 adenosine deaminase TadA